MTYFFSHFFICSHGSISLVKWCLCIKKQSQCSS